MQRFRNYGFWVSLAALIPMACQLLGITHMPDNYNDIVNAGLTLLVAAGIVSNPTTSNKGFVDDKSKPTEPIEIKTIK